MHLSAAALLLAAAATASAPVPASGDGDAPGARMTLAQVTIRERIVIRVPAAPPQPLPVPIRWAEKKGPKCIAADQLAGAIVQADDRVDLVLKGGARVRAELGDDCDGLASYGGFYVKPSADGQVCAGRDAIRTRLGDACPIRRFRKLVARR